MRTHYTVMYSFWVRYISVTTILFMPWWTMIYIFGHLFSRGGGVHCINPFFFSFLLVCIVLFSCMHGLRACYWINEWKKRSEETQTLRVSSSKAEPKFRPAAVPLLGSAGRPKFNQLETVTTFTYKPNLVKIDARNFELSRPTNTHSQTDSTDYNTLRRS